VSDPKDPLGELSGERADRVYRSRRSSLVARAAAERPSWTPEAVEALVARCEANLDPETRGEPGYWHELELCLEAERAGRRFGDRLN
jgi:hypothetical protein